MYRKSQRGFTLMEILVVVAIIAILGAIAIVNYISALNRAKAKKTVADIRAIATAWEARAGEHGRYNAAGFTFPDTPVAYSDLKTMLMPTYTQTLPAVDGWNRPLEFAIEGTPATFYGIRSPGRDGAYEGQPYTSGATTDPDCDIVYSGGSFIVYPDVVQSGN
jgi:type II secretion system protein G